MQSKIWQFPGPRKTFRRLLPEESGYSNVNERQSALLWHAELKSIFPPGLSWLSKKLQNVFQKVIYPAPILFPYSIIKGLRKADQEAESIAEYWVSALRSQLNAMDWVLTHGTHTDLSRQASLNMKRQRACLEKHLWNATDCNKLVSLPKKKKKIKAACASSLVLF